MKQYQVFLMAAMFSFLVSGCHGQQTKQPESVNNQEETNKMRKIDELINTEENGFDLVKEWLSAAKNEVEILPRDEKRAAKVLYETQVTTRSPMGAIVYETGGILINKGWLRILGSGSEKLNRELSSWNKGKSFVEYGEQPSFLLIADDVVGGFFAINGGGISKDNLGQIFYFAPDVMDWECLNVGYSGFIQWAFTGDVHLFYETFYWNGYMDDLTKINGEQAMSFYPFLFTEEGKDINTVSKKVVPVEELWDFNMEQGKK